MFQFDLSTCVEQMNKEVENEKIEYSKDGLLQIESTDYD